jgi:hypothetical protein
MSGNNHACELDDELHFSVLAGDSTTLRGQTASHVGREDTVIRTALIRALPKQSSNTLTFVGGPQPFSAGDELQRLLGSAPSYSADQLAPAKEAINRLSRQLSDVETHDNAERLAADFMLHED